MVRFTGFLLASVVSMPVCSYQANDACQGVVTGSSVNPEKWWRRAAFPGVWCARRHKNATKAHVGRREDRCRADATTAGVARLWETATMGVAAQAAFGRLAQWESASFTRKKSQVQILYRPPTNEETSADAPRSLAICRQADWITVVGRTLLAMLLGQTLEKEAVQLPIPARERELEEDGLLCAVLSVDDADNRLGGLLLRD